MIFNERASRSVAERRRYRPVWKPASQRCLPTVWVAKHLQESYRSDTRARPASSNLKWGSSLSVTVSQLRWRHWVMLCYNDVTGAVLLYIEYYKMVWVMHSDLQCSMYRGNTRKCQVNWPQVATISTHAVHTYTHTLQNWFCPSKGLFYTTIMLFHWMFIFILFLFLARFYPSQRIVQQMSQPDVSDGSSWNTTNQGSQL